MTEPSRTLRSTKTRPPPSLSNPNPLPVVKLKTRIRSSLTRCSSRRSSLKKSSSTLAIRCSSPMIRLASLCTLLSSCLAYLLFAVAGGMSVSVPLGFGRSFPCSRLGKYLSTRSHISRLLPTVPRSAGGSTFVQKRTNSVKIWKPFRMSILVACLRMDNSKPSFSSFSTLGVAQHDA